MMPNIQRVSIGDIDPYDGEDDTIKEKYEIEFAQGTYVQCVAEVDAYGVASVALIDVISSQGDIVSDIFIRTGLVQCVESYCFGVLSSRVKPLASRNSDLN